MVDNEDEKRPGGEPVVDPTENVKALSEAVNKRQDDLRDAKDRLFHEQFDSIKEMVALRDDHLKEIVQFQVAHAAEMLAVMGKRLDEQAILRAEYTDRLAVAEAKRIDAIRAVDVNAVSVAAERQSAQATVLASQVSQSADTLRTLVASTATTVAASQQALQAVLGDRIAKLEQAQYTGAGRSAVADPQIAELITQVGKLALANSTASGKETGIGVSWGVVLGIISLMVGLMMIYTFITRPVAVVPVTAIAPPAAAAPAPVIEYVPASPGTLIPRVIPSK